MSSNGLNVPLAHANGGDRLPSAFVRGLSRHGRLDPEDIRFIEAKMGEGRRYNAGDDLARQGDPPPYPHLILDGWAFCYKTLPNHRRQIVAILLPGDMSDMNIGVLQRMDHSIAALTTVHALPLSHDLIDTFASGIYPRIAWALRAKTVAAAAIQREWAVNLGQRSAPERIGHILCELFHRLRAVGLTSGTQCFLPLTQTDLAEVTGLSLVHVNKRLRDFRASGLIVLRGKILSIPDLPALEAASLFRPDYLNLVDVGDHEPG
jgi:CRP-like cAMP-binding protein